MDELIRRIQEKAGLGPDLAERVVAIILNFLHRDGPPEATRALVEHLPGAEHMIEEAAPTASGSSGLLGGFAEMMAGGEGIMAAFNDLTAAGLDMDQIQTSVQTFVAFAREKAGDQVVDDVIKAMPGLSRMV